MSRIISLVAEGDSITAQYFGYVFQAGGYPTASVPGNATFGSAAAAQWRFQIGDVIGANLAVGGSHLTAQLLPRAANADALLAPAAGHPPLSVWESTRPTRKYIFSLMIGTNPDADATTHVANMATYLAARVSAGFHGLIVCTLPDRGDGITANFNSAYSSPINALLRGNAFLNQFGVPCVCADFAAEPLWGADGASANTTYFLDTIHPTTALYALVVPTYLTALNALVARL